MPNMLTSNVRENRDILSHVEAACEMVERMAQTRQELENEQRRREEETARLRELENERRVVGEALRAVEMIQKLRSWGRHGREEDFY